MHLVPARTHSSTSHTCVLQNALAAIYTATRLGVADLLQQHGPMPAAALASRLNVKEDALARVLRCLSAHGVFKEVGGRMLPRALLTHRTTPTAADATHSASCRIPPTDLSWHVCQQPRQQRAAR